MIQQKDQVKSGPYVHTKSSAGGPYLRQLGPLSQYYSRRQGIAPAAPMAVRRLQKSRRIYVRPWTDPQSAHLWWPAVAKLQAASVPIPRQLRHGTERRTDRAIPVVSMNTIGGSGQRFMVESTLVIIVAAIRPT